MSNKMKWRVLALGMAMVAFRPPAGPAQTVVGQHDAAEQNGAVEIDARALQARIQDASRKALPSVVAIAHGTGVIVSADGLILSQRHVVTHPFPDAKPGFSIRVLLADGELAEAELLGIDPLYDLVALKLAGPGPYPYSPLADDQALEPDSGVLKLGHPVGGPKAGRPPVVRFGRVLVSTSDQFICDCLVNGGDSGGPFVDLNGRVVGLQGPPGIAVQWPTSLQQNERLAVKEMDRRTNYLDTGRTASLLRKRLPALIRPEIVAASSDDKDQKRADDVAMTTAPTLSVARWGQGPRSLSQFNVKEMSRSVVEVVGAGNEVLALGTIVDTNGLVLTICAPAVTETTNNPSKISCRLADGRVMIGAVVGVDPAYNLALLKIDADRLNPVDWADQHAPSVGTLVAAVGPGKMPVAAGIVSVPRRHIAAAQPVPLGHLPAAPFELSGKFEANRGYVIESAEEIARDGGILRGDIIVSIGGTPIRCEEDMSTYAANRRAGEQAIVQVLRDGRTTEIALSFSRPRDLYDWNFYPPFAFESDLPILPSEHGCPVVGLDGKAMGVAVGRIAPQACIIVPSDRVMARLEDLKVGKPLASVPRVP